MHKDILFLTLKMLSATGGVEKVCRVVSKSIHQILQEAGGVEKIRVYSMHDDAGCDTGNYLPGSQFKGFGVKKLQFVVSSIRKGMNSRVVVLSHINLLIIGYVVKLVSPSTRVFMIAHGIEVWRPFPKWKIGLLKKIDLILPVSDFTKGKMMALYGISENRLQVLNNCLDPFLPEPETGDKDPGLLQQYGFSANDVILMTLTRLSSTEKYKGYDDVLKAVRLLKDRHPNIKYLIVGKYDAIEKQRMDQLISELQISDRVVLTGFIPDAALARHYNLADVYIMPSQKEGFGIVFIEALYYGKPVIAGNKDGSVDALAKGKFGKLVNPDSLEEITSAIDEMLQSANRFKPNRQDVLNHFGFDQYTQKWKKLIAIQQG